MFKYFVPFVMTTLMIFLVLLVFGIGYDIFFNNKTCVTYSEEKTKHGFIMSGKQYIPTTYQGRDCLVWGEK